MPKGRIKNKRKSAGGEVLSTPEKNAAGIKSEKVGLATLSPTPTPVAVGKGTVAAIPELWNFTLVGMWRGMRLWSQTRIRIRLRVWYVRFLQLVGIPGGRKRERG